MIVRFGIRTRLRHAIGLLRGDSALDRRVSVHPRAILLPTAAFRFQRAGGSVRIGADSMVGCSFVFESDQGSVEIGERSYVSGGTQCISRTSIQIGSDVTIAWGCYFYDHNSHSLDWRERANDIRRQNAAFRRGEDFIVDKDWSVVKSAGITIRDKAWIGFDVVVMSGVEVGEGAVIGARSVVRESVPAWRIVAGNPAKVVGTIDPDRRARTPSPVVGPSDERGGA